MKKTILILVLAAGIVSVGWAQFFEMKKMYTGSHYAFSRFNPNGINQFVVQFNKMWADDIATGFSQYKGTELGQTFTTSGMRFIWGKNDKKWTASTDYAFGAGKTKNKVEFKNGMSQVMNLRATSNQVNLSFGMTFKDNKYWLEGLYSTNITKVMIEYATIHQNGVESYGTEYKLNGLYRGDIKTMEFGVQASYKYKKYVMYTRVLIPTIVTGPNKNERGFVDERSTQLEPKDFPSNYETYVNDPEGHVSRREGLQSTNFKGFSYGFGIFYLIGKAQ
ncbi:MAG: hypothetical protein ACK4K0_04560 [Flavobacteriales bacterium]